MDNWGPAAKLIGIGFFIIACILGGIMGGLWLDRVFETRPIILITGLILGLIAAFWGVYQIIAPMMKDNYKNRR